MANEKRLIEVESAWKKAQRIYSDPVLLHVVRNVLDSTPTVDAVEVVHGRWVKTETNSTCSVCGANVISWSGEYDGYEKERGICLMHYCPNCGAKMDGGCND